jgi:hypothetical protein
MYMYKNKRIIFSWYYTRANSSWSTGSIFATSFPVPPPLLTISKQDRYLNSMAKFIPRTWEWGYTKHAISNTVMIGVYSPLLGGPAVAAAWSSASSSPAELSLRQRTSENIGEACPSNDEGDATALETGSESSVEGGEEGEGDKRERERGGGGVEKYSIQEHSATYM